MTKSSNMKWWLLLAGPVFFLLIIVAFSVYVGSKPGIKPEQIPNYVSAYMSNILLTVQVLLFLLLAWLLINKRIEIEYIVNRKSLGKDALIGIVIGSVLAAAYIFFFSPLLTDLQSNIGDFVPPGEILPAVSKNIIMFFIANVILAPFVEESIYRGYSLPILQNRYGVINAILVSSVFFGILHWAGGVWYMILTGLVAGGVFSSAFYLRKDIYISYIGHLTLNFIEFIYVFLK